jgi:hypothetical protein
MAKAKQAEEREEATKVDRWTACHRVVAGIESEASMTELVALAEEMIVESGGGKADPDATEQTIWNVISTAAELKVLTIETIVRKVKK